MSIIFVKQVERKYLIKQYLLDVYKIELNGTGGSKENYFGSVCNPANLKGIHE